MGGNSSVLSILVVDNDPKTLKLLKMRLSSVGYEVFTAKNGPDGIKAYNKYRPTLTMLDVNMPVMSGLEVLREIKKINQEATVIIMTAFGSEGVAVEALKKGASDYINKPFDNKEIMFVVKENIERTLVVEERDFLLSQMKSTTSELLENIKELKDSNTSLIGAITKKTDLLLKLEHANSHLLEMSIRDGLTQLYNHVYFQERLAEEFSRAARYDTLLSLIMIDIDDFKRVNDCFGHQTGDEVLVKLAQILIDSVRVIDVAARYGGEEFMLMLPQIDQKGAEKTAKRLGERIRSEFNDFFDDSEFVITVSGGIATVPQKSINTKYEFIKRVDSALYEAKRTGKNRMICGT
ncbi:MAG: diguanylate cyclase [bacterium]